MRSKYYQYTTDILDPVIPLSFFKKLPNLTPAQVLAVFLHDELELGWIDAGILVGRDEGTIRHAYVHALDKIKNNTKRRSPNLQPRTGHDAGKRPTNSEATTKRPAGTKGGKDLPDL